MAIAKRALTTTYILFTRAKRALTCERLPAYGLTVCYCKGMLSKRAVRAC